MSVVIDTLDLETDMYCKAFFFSSMYVFSDHQRVILYLRVWLGWCVRRTQGFILVRAEHPYVQLAAAHVTST